MHLALLAVLVFSLDWTPEVRPTTARKQAPVQAIAVDGARLDEQLRRKQQQEDEKRLAVEQAAQRKAEAERKRKADIAAQKKAEAERRQKAEQEAKRKVEAERKRKADIAAQKKAEAERRQKAEQEAKRKAEQEARRKAQAELQARVAAEQAQMAAQRQSAMQSMINEYVGYIRDKVQRSWIRPQAAAGDLACSVTVRLLPGGDVVDVRIVRSSGDRAFDQSVEKAVLRASPLPVPPDPEVMEQFRTISFEFRPDY